MRRNSPRRLRKKQWDDDDDGMRRSEQNERYERVYAEVTKFRDLLREHYVDMLTEKVQQQRKDIKERERKSRERRLNEEQQRHQQWLQTLKENLKGVPVVSSSSAKSDESEAAAAEPAPKSRYYQILAVQRKLMQQKKLNSFAAVERFWRQQLQSIESTGQVLPADSSQLLRSDDRPPSGELHGRPPSMRRRRRRRKSGDEARLGTLYEDETDSDDRKDDGPQTRSARRFPAVPKPELKSFTIDLSPKTLSDAEFLKMCERYDKRRRRTLFLQQLDVVSQKATAHSLLSRKQLQSHDSLAALRDRFDDYYDEEDEDLDFRDSDLREPTLRDQILNFDRIAAKSNLPSINKGHDDHSLPSLIELYTAGSPDSKLHDTVKSSMSKQSRFSRSDEEKHLVSIRSEEPSDPAEQPSEPPEKHLPVPLSFEQMLLHPHDFQSSSKSGLNPHFIWLPRESL